MFAPSLRIFSAAAAIALLAVPAMAQTVNGSVGTGGTASRPGVSTLSNSQTARNRNQAPAFHLFGIPVVIQAPVNAPYDSEAAYSTFAGQPGYGPNAVLAASDGGVP